MGSKKQSLCDLNGETWQQPQIRGEIPHGDMPGDKVEINEGHIKKANVIFPRLIKLIQDVIVKNESQKVVLTVCGGSGVGKSEIASLISYYFNELGIGSYTLSGDNYPNRIPKYNDAERLSCFRKAGMKEMVSNGLLTADRWELIHKYQIAEDDANKIHETEHDWYKTYLQGGRTGLKNYLGTNWEIDFNELEEIISFFKRGDQKIWLKRMGREASELWYEEVDFREIQVLVIEWTHGNSDNYKGVDIPILLNSTPEETLAHRKARNRDGATDSPFTTTVLELEQEMLIAQAHKAKIILSKSGEILNYDNFRANLCKDNKI